jgi:hypothetical protein
MLLRIGCAAPTPATPRRRRDDVVLGRRLPADPLPAQEPPASTGWPVSGRSG